MSKYYLLDENKNAIPCSLMEWAGQLENMKNNKHVAKEEVNGKMISTVWVGLNHQYNNKGFPLIFETMVFDNDMKDIYMDRYSNWQEAEKGHKKAKQWVLNGCKNVEQIKS